MWRPTRPIVLTALLTAAGAADAECLGSLQAPLRDVEGMIHSLRSDPELPSRMVGQDGASYESLRVHWMQQQLELIEDACRRGHEVEATWRVEALQRELEAGAATPVKPERPLHRHRAGLLAASGK
jgi:hypothetical protein